MIENSSEQQPASPPPATAPQPVPARPTWRLFAVATVLVVGLGLGAFVGVPYVRNATAGGSERLNLKPAKDFTASLYSGGRGSFTLSRQKGKPVVLNFWASWCAPCRSEFPVIQAAADKYAGQVVFFGADIQDTEKEAKAFLQEQQTTFMTGPDATGSIAVDYGLVGLPVTFFITPDGHIYKQWIGEIDEQRMDTFIQELLKV